MIVLYIITKNFKNRHLVFLMSTEDCCRARLQNFLLTARSDSGDDTYTYEDKSESPKAKYIVVPSPKLSYPVKRVRVDEGAPDNVILTLCEVFIFGGKY